jgi:hypothetical protein
LEARLGKSRVDEETILLRDLVRETLGIERGWKDMLASWGVVLEEFDQADKDRTTSSKPIEPATTGLTDMKIEKGESSYKQTVIGALKQTNGHIDAAAKVIKRKTGKPISGRTVRRHVYAIGDEATDLLAEPGRDAEYDVENERWKSDSETKRDLEKWGGEGGKGALKGKKTKTNPKGEEK